MTKMREAFKGIYGHYPIEGESFIWEGFKDGWQARLEHIKSQGAVAWWTGIDVGEDEQDFMTERLRKAHEAENSFTPRDYLIPLYRIPED